MVVCARNLRIITKQIVPARDLQEVDSAFDAMVEHALVCADCHEVMTAIAEILEHKDEERNFR